MNLEFEKNDDNNTQVPKYEIINTTYWYRWLILALLNTFIILITIPFLRFGKEENQIPLIYILFAFPVLFPLIIGFFRKKIIRTFHISKHPKLQHREETKLIYNTKMRNLKISSKHFQLNEIERFEVIQRKKRNSLKWYCALVFKTGKYITITTLLDEPLAFHYAKELNEFLVANSSLNIELLRKPLIPYIPRKEQKKIKVISFLKISLIIFVICLLILIFVIFWIANIEILPAFIILITLVCMGCLLVMALNGATFDSL